MPEDAVQFVRGVLPSTVTVGSTYTLPPHNEPHVVLLIVDEGVVVHHAWSPCVVVHLAPLGSGPSGSAATVKKGMNWFASSASPVKLTDEERVRADAARERFTQGEQRIESRRQAERERHAAHAAGVADERQRHQEALRARWHAEAHSKPWDNSFCWPWPNAGVAALVITILLLGFFPFKTVLSSDEVCLSVCYEYESEPYSSDRVAILVVSAALLAAGFLFCVRWLAKWLWFDQLPDNDPRKPKRRGDGYSVHGDGDGDGDWIV